MSAIARLFRDDRMEINIRTKGTSNEANIMWLWR